jgi:hypothetical protein
MTILGVCGVSPHLVSQLSQPNRKQKLLVITLNEIGMAPIGASDDL